MEDHRDVTGHLTRVLGWKGAQGIDGGAWTRS